MKITYNHLPKFFTLLDKYNNEDIASHFINEEDTSEILIDFAMYIRDLDNPRLMHELMRKFDLQFTKQVFGEEPVFMLELQGEMFFSYSIIIDDTCPKLLAFFKTLIEKSENNAI